MASKGNCQKDGKCQKDEKCCSGKALEGKVAIITGSSAGIGAGIAERFAQEGALVSITGRNAKSLDAVAEKCKAANGKEAVKTVGEITDEKVLKALVKNTLDAFGKIDILVNNAGIFREAPLAKCDMELYDDVLNVNLRAPYYLTALCTPHLIKTQGNVVNISSVLSVKAEIAPAAYCMSKAALDMFTKCSAKELAPHQVRVNSVNPGYIHDTEVIKRNEGVSDEDDKKFRAMMQSVHALGRSGTVDECSSVVTFLASNQASFVTGVILLVDGGAAIHNQPQGKM